MITTPFGTWYHTPVFDAQEMPVGYPPNGTDNTVLWEGACWLHSGSLSGPVIGKAYLELPNTLIATYPALMGGSTRAPGEGAR